MKKKTVKKDELQTRTFFHDVTDLFDGLKDISDDSFNLGKLKQNVDNLVMLHGENSDISVELEGDEYYTSWSWMIAESRLETKEEQKERLQREKKYELDKKKREAKYEREEKKEYLRLKKKFESK